MSVLLSPLLSGAPPAYQHIPADQPRIIQLRHLEHVREDGDYTPFTERQHTAFSEARRTSVYARRGLIAGGIISVFAALSSGGIAVASVLAQTVPVKMGMAAAAGFCGACSPLSGSIFAGCIPHLASEAANRDQDEFESAKSMYRGFAEELRLMGQLNRENATAFLNELHIQEIHNVMLRCLNENRVNLLLQPLRDAKANVLDQLELMGDHSGSSTSQAEPPPIISAE